MAERWIITINGASTVLPVTNRQGAVRVLEQETPAPEPVDSTADRTEGALVTSRGWQPRQVTLRLVVERPTDQWWDEIHDFGALPAEAEGEGTVPGWRGTVRQVDPAGSPIVAALGDLARIVGEMQAAPGSIAGTLTRVMESGQRIVFDVLTAAMPEGPAWTQEVYLRDVTQVTLRFTCLPFARGQETLLRSASRGANQRLVVMDDLQVPGDVPALARIKYSGAIVDQRSLLYGIDRPDAASRATGVQIDSRSLDPAPACILSFGGGIVSATGTWSRPATTIDAGWVRIVDLRRSGVPLPLTGTYRVLARMRNYVWSTSPVRARLRWTSGVRDVGMTSNQPTLIPASSRWSLVDLGMVTATGQLDGVVEITSPHYDVQLDVLLLVPTVRSAVLQASAAIPANDLVMRETGGGSGALVGSAASLGGSWADPGSGTGATWTRLGSGVSRTSAAGAWRAAAVSLSTAPTMSARAVLWSASTTGDWQDRNAVLIIGNDAGIAAIGTNATGGTGAWAVAMTIARPAVVGSWGKYISVRTVVDGSAPVIATDSGAWPAYAPSVLSIAAGEVVVECDGARIVLPLPDGMPATGLRVAVGSAGVGAGGAAIVSDISVWAGASRADVALAAGESTTVATSGSTRTTADSLTGPVVPAGDRPLLPVSGAASLPVRFVAGVVAGRLDDQHDPGTFVGGVSGLPGVVTVDLYATPRYLQVPS